MKSKRLISLFLSMVVLLTAIPLNVSAYAKSCSLGGTIAQPIGGFNNFINANAAGSGGRGVLEINMKTLVEGTAIKLNDIYGIEAVTLGLGAENRQAYIDVNIGNGFAASPMFHGSSSFNAERIWAIMAHGNTPNNGGRTEQNTLRYMNIYAGNPKVASNTTNVAPFVDSENPDSFIVRIRPNDNWSSLVTAITLLDENGEVLGATAYSTDDSNGSWSQFMSLVECGECRSCVPTVPEIVTNPNEDTFVYENYTIDYQIHNSWEDNGVEKQNVQVTITNTGTETIENWMLAYDFNGEIEGIWNGSVANTAFFGLDYIRNMGYNANILPGQSTSFGYILTSVMGVPNSIAMCQERVEKDDGFTAELKVNDEWSGGFIGKVVLTNTTDKPIEWWELTIDTNFTITEIAQNRYAVVS